MVGEIQRKIEEFLVHYSPAKSIAIPHEKLVLQMLIHSKGSYLRWTITGCVVHKDDYVLILPLAKYMEDMYILYSAEALVVASQKKCPHHEIYPSFTWKCPCGKSSEYLYELVNEDTGCRLWVESICIKRYLPWLKRAVVYLESEAERLHETFKCHICRKRVKKSMKSTIRLDHNICISCEYKHECAKCGCLFDTKGYRSMCRACYGHSAIRVKCIRCGELFSRLPHETYKPLCLMCFKNKRIRV